MASVFTEAQLRIICEIQRIAKALDTDSLSQDDFDKHHNLGGVTTAGGLFGSWNLAVKAAGLKPNPPHGISNRKYSDDELLQEVLRVHKQIGKRPSERQMLAFGQYSIKPYSDRWGSFVKARETAYERYGQPE